MSAKMSEQSRGVYIIAATPFDQDGELDLNSTDTLIDFYLEKGVSGITILGMMGEAPKLTSDESLLFMRRVMTRVNGRVPVVVGISHPAHRQVALLAKSAMSLGAAGVMLAPVANLKTEEQVVNYYLSVAALLGDDIPLCLQDFPQSTGVHCSVETILRLVEALPQLVMLKHEDLPGLRKLSQVRRQSEARGLRRISILAGNGGLFWPQEMRRGADGAMTGFAYPEMLVQMCRLFDEGRDDEAEDVFDCYLPLLRHEFQYGIGLALRQPGPRLDREDLQELDALISRLERRLAALNG